MPLAVWVICICLTGMNIICVNGSTGQKAAVHTRVEAYLEVDRDSSRSRSNMAHNSLLAERRGCYHHKASKGKTSLEDLQHSV